MGQQSWSFTDYFGTEHNFGIYHGEESGHLVCYLDNSIMHINFSIKDDYQFSFFMEEELLIFKIKKINESYEYSFELDKESQTPLNVKRKTEEKNNKYRIMIGIIIALLILKLLAYMIIRKLS